jgi:hypothetical protein
VRKKLTAEEILGAAELACNNQSLETIRLGIGRPDVSIMCISRALQSVRDFRARIQHARASGDYSGLSIAEYLFAIRQVMLPGVSDANATRPEGCE